MLKTLKPAAGFSISIPGDIGGHCAVSTPHDAGPVFEAFAGFLTGVERSGQSHGYYRQSRRVLRLGFGKELSHTLGRIKAVLPHEVALLGYYCTTMTTARLVRSRTLSAVRASCGSSPFASVMTRVGTMPVPRR